MDFTKKNWIFKKIWIFQKHLDFSKTFGFFKNIWIFQKHFDFSKKIWIQKNGFFKKNWIFEHNFVCKLFWTLIWIHKTNGSTYEPNRLCHLALISVIRKRKLWFWQKFLENFWSYNYFHKFLIFTTWTIPQITVYYTYSRIVKSKISDTAIFKKSSKADIWIFMT